MERSIAQVDPTCINGAAVNAAAADRRESCAHGHMVEGYEETGIFRAQVGGAIVVVRLCERIETCTCGFRRVLESARYGAGRLRHQYVE